MKLVLVGLEVGMVEKDAVSKDFRKQVLGYGLTTAEIWHNSDAAQAPDIECQGGRTLR